ncbi:hypothetical protein PF005_g8227 [Phytophthora fragariae]|uniref:Uncharacterized protein n=1 Tax=Phytophthora fragariae TaxID=53985 RepID=A0A6A3YHS2_9STRA|nr:hypothetical protein PF003_g449 [Phytophthora fragariae]KAE8946602.1 hypothetical protein PF009_g3776 [Phytophthora fragariae]KAE9120318.1 hypothetical protein PF007_g8222 [Phytophthora fragariae]KAE9139215.1 hypothetical protein PF010_g681 [Phytophthora fragariae]KAE9152919.1 hypothetical protein PF006_g2906 [Phytophthora fragariae]
MDELLQSEVSSVCASRHSDFGIAETKLKIESADCEAITDETTTSSPRLLRWTVKKPGITTPPTSDDYTQWTVEQLRKECTSRKLRVSRMTPTEERIIKLVAFDGYQLSLIAQLVESAPLSKASTEPRSKHCCARVLTMLF